MPQTTARPQRQTQRPVTQAPSNPFFPTQRPNNNPFLNPNPVTQAPVIRPTPAPTRATTTTTTTTPRPITSAPTIDTKASNCKDPDDRSGACIPLVQCKELTDKLLLYQSDTIFQDYLRVSNRLCGGTATDICCPINLAPIQPVTASPLIRNTGEVPRRLPTPDEGCGYTSKSFRKIVGGEVSQKGSWPWIALIGYDDGLSATPFKCGGALVTARHIVTAAHCLRKDL